MSTSTPLVTASCRGHTGVVDTLLEHPETMVNMSVSGGWTALMWAAWYGHTEVVSQFESQAARLHELHASLAAAWHRCDLLCEGQPDGSLVIPAHNQSEALAILVPSIGTAANLVADLLPRQMVASEPVTVTPPRAA